jgi:CAAX protease family protein
LRDPLTAPAWPECRHNRNLLTIKERLDAMSPHSGRPITEQAAVRPGTGAAARHGFGRLAARRPITVFLALVFGIGWPIEAIAVLSDHGMLPGGELPVEVFALAVTLFVMLPAALWVTWACDDRQGVNALLRRTFRWRFAIGWWAVVLFGLPICTLALGLLVGGSLQTRDLPSILLGQTLSIAIAVLVINLWEETVWAGFMQTRLEYRYRLPVAAALTAVPFAGVHMPLLLIGHFTAASLLLGVGGLLLLGILVRLMIGVVLRGAADSLLAVGILHQLFDSSNNKEQLVDKLLIGADQSVLVLPATALLTAVAAVVLKGRLSRRRAPAG